MAATSERSISGGAARRLSLLDQCLINFDQALRTVCGGRTEPERPSPAAALAGDGALTDEERRLAARLMRVNHAGEIAAQALYHGQALTARRGAVRETMMQAAREENDHLAWCRDRLHELGGGTSLLDPAWYAGSLVIGALAGAAGDAWSLGFLAETERQVVAHLEDHLHRLPAGDAKGHAILRQMRDDESRHATTAVNAGARPLPGPVKALMSLASRVMTGTAYWV